VILAVSYRNYFIHRQPPDRELPATSPDEGEKSTSGELRAVGTQDSAAGQSENLCSSSPGESSKEVSPQKKPAPQKPSNWPDNSGFLEVAPGVFQFKHHYEHKPAFTMLPDHFASPAIQVKKLCWQAGLKPAEAGFIRVNGLPGPNQNFRTPVYQFT